MGRKRKNTVPTRELLVAFGNLLNAVGPDDSRVDAFIEKHKANNEFAFLAQMTRWLKGKFLERQKGKRQR